MLPEIGLACLIVSLVLCSVAAISLVLWCTDRYSNIYNFNIVRPLILGQGCFIWCAALILWYLFYVDDFSVLYVAQHSHSQLPIFYKLTAFWGGHEGSLLLWIVILSGWSLALLIRYSQIINKFNNLVLAILSLVSGGLLLILLWSSNPFTRIIANIPVDGADLNPLLQDVAMVMHPPILYVGYVGTGVAFAYAVAGLLQKKFSEQWCQQLRGWVLVAWCFLTVGITLGSWWAYYELGWGGWWFWDPVENASFMPWLILTALLHSLNLNRISNRGLHLSILLGIVAFALSILGTFLVRSGAITSVHAFVAAPQRGVYVLQFMAIIIGGSFLLYALRANKLQLPSNYHPVSTWQRGLLLNNVFLLSGCVTVFLGTLYPLFYELICHEQISVGYPYFNTVFVPQMLLMLLVLLYIMQPRWRKVLFSIAISMSISLLLLYVLFKKVNVYSLVGLTIAMSVLFAQMLYLRNKFMFKQLGMHVAHFGLVISIIGMSVTPLYQVERDLRMSYGDSVEIADYRVDFLGVRAQTGVNYVAQIGSFVVSKRMHEIARLLPEKRHYLSQDVPLTETAIFPGVFADLYIALGQELSAQEWSVRIYYKPLVRWIWIGAITMAFGGMLSVMLRRRDVE